MQTQIENSSEPVESLDEFQCYSLLDEYQYRSRKLNNRIRSIQCHPEYDRCSMWERQERELKRVAVMMSDQTQLCVCDAMTPNNFDWIYDDIVKILKILAWEPNAISWILGMKLPIEVYEGHDKFGRALLDQLMKEERKNSTVYARLPFFFTFLPYKSKEELRLDALHIHYDTANIPRLEKTKLKERIIELEQALETADPSNKENEVEKNRLDQAIEEFLPFLSDLNKLKIIKLAQKLKDERHLTLLG